MNNNKISGVYKITNKVTKEFYIGSSNDVKHRLAGHKCCSAWKKQPNFKLYKDMAEFGRDNFIFEIIEETSNLKEREQYWIDKLKPSYNSYRASGFDIERYKEYQKEYQKERHKAHRDEELAKMKAYQSRLCFYDGETLTLNALTSRFHCQSIPHARVEAKKYLIEGEN